MARQITAKDLNDARAIAKEVLAKGEIYRGEELLAEVVLYLTERPDSGTYAESCQACCLGDHSRCTGETTLGTKPCLCREFGHGKVGSQ